MTDYYALREEIRLKKLKLEQCIYTYEHLRGLSVIEFAEHERHPDYADMAALYDLPMKHLAQEIEDLKQMIPLMMEKMPNEKFLRLFGMFLHEAYREKHPFGSSAEIVKGFGQFGGSMTHYYPLIQPETIQFIGDDFAHAPMTIDRRTGEATYERYATADRRMMVELAWAPEIHTIFYR